MKKMQTIIRNYKSFLNERGLPDGIRRGDDPDVKEALTRLGVLIESDFAKFYQNLAGPFGEMGTTYPYLLDVIAGVHTVEQFTREFYEAFDPPDDFLAISEIDQREGLYYNIKTQAVFFVEFDYDFEAFFNSNLQPLWPSFGDFIFDYFKQFQPVEE